MILVISSSCITVNKTSFACSAARTKSTQLIKIKHDRYRHRYICDMLQPVGTQQGIKATVHDYVKSNVSVEIGENEILSHSFYCWRCEM